MQGSAFWKRIVLSVFVVTLLPLAGLPGSAGQDAPCAPVADTTVPAHAATDGTPFTFRYGPSGCHDAYHEVRLWLGDDAGDTQASRVWNGTSWASSTRYIPLPSADADGTVWPTMQTNPDGTHAETLLVAGAQATVWGQWRGHTGTSDRIALGTLTLVGAEDVHPVWDADGRIVVPGDGGSIVAAAPTGVDAAGRPLPNGYGHVALPPGRSIQGDPAPAAAGSVLLQRVGPALAPGSWDLVELRVVDPALDDLQGLRIGDGEGWLTLPTTPVPASGVVQLIGPGAEHAPTPWSDSGDALRIPWTNDRGDPWHRTETDGPFALAKSGDGIVLAYGDVMLDAFRYGDDATHDAPGWQGEAVEATRIDGRLFVRAQTTGTLIDTDRADDWTHPRVHRQHQGDRFADWQQADGPLRAFVCPDRCWEEVLLRIEGASHTLDVNLYDLTLTEAVDALATAAGRGVDVRLLLHDRPIGASRDHMARTAWAVERLQEAGVAVRVHEGLRFDVNHAKYLVADASWTVVLSENAVASGWSPSGADGNRGWGVAVADHDLAAWFGALFHDDFSHPVDTHAVTADDFSRDPRPGYTGPAARATTDRLETLVVHGPVRLRPLVAPDHLGDPTNSPLVVALDNARHEVWTQQLNLPLRWTRPGHAEPSPLVTAMDGAAARNVTVLGTLAGAFEDGDPTTDGNDRTATEMSLHPLVDVRLGSAPGGGTIHNKGWLVDPVPDGRNLVIVGSANGNLASQAMNREVDIMIENAAVAAYYRAVLVEDQQRADALGASLIGGASPQPQALPGAAAGALVATLALLAALVRRPRA